MKNKNSRKIGSVALANIHEKGFSMVSEVVDATENLEIDITESDCRKGIPLDHTKCPGALGTIRAADADGAIIATRTAYVIRGRKAIRYRIPESLTREEVAIDRGGSFHPGKYTLKKPGKGERLDDQKYRGKTANKSNRRSPSFTPHVTEGMRSALGSRLHIS